MVITLIKDPEKNCSVVVKKKKKKHICWDLR